MVKIIFEGKIMDFAEVVKKRRSVRLYNPAKKISQEQIAEIITTAQQAPSWKNSQTGRYYAILEPNMREKVRACLNIKNQTVTKDVSALLVTTFVKNVSGFDKNKNPENELANGWGCYDLGLQNAYLILKAADMGIDTIILGLRDAVALRQVLKIPQDEEIVAVIALGYRSEQELKAPTRKSLAEILSYC